MTRSHIELNPDDGKDLSSSVGTLRSRTLRIASAAELETWKVIELSIEACTEI